MEYSEIVEALFTKRELKRLLQKSCSELQQELERKDFSIATFYSFDIVRLYQFLGEPEKAQSQCEKTLEYIEQSKHQWREIRRKCLIALGRKEEAREVVLNDPYPTKNLLAHLYEELGDYDLAQDFYTELATGQSREADESTYFRPQLFQYASDFWEKAGNMKEARTYNQKAVEVWERIGPEKESLRPIERAWLHEEVGYIYQKAGNFEAAMDYYRKAWVYYKEAYTEDLEATVDHLFDGDWDFYAPWFLEQIPHDIVFEFRCEHPMRYDQRRMRYRKLSTRKSEDPDGSWDSLS
ncbi:MAG: tetratricopeptide repeat protein [Theionarchaea archaeon]|nr:tetratricopeptide repeat protein [Theionarchaea archaeon]